MNINQKSRKKYNKDNLKQLRNELQRPHYAAIYGYEEIVTILLDRGGEVSAKENKGIMAICYAAQKKHGKVFRMLLDKHCRT